MALVQCKECDNQISISASACPKCGAKVKRTSTAVKAFGTLLALGVLSAALTPKGDSPSEMSQSIAARRVAGAATVTTEPGAGQIESSQRPNAAAGVPTNPTVAVTPRALSLSDAQIENAIADSDDFMKHREAFMSASRKLILEKRCTLAQLKEYGGWVRSQNYKSRAVYFTYSGAGNVSYRIYLDVETGETFK